MVRGMTAVVLHRQPPPLHLALPTGCHLAILSVTWNVMLVVAVVLVVVVGAAFSSSSQVNAESSLHVSEP